MFGTLFRPWSLWLALGLSALFLPGCPLFSDVEPQKEVTFQHEAGSSHVAVLAVAPWDDVRESLEPKFQMTADKALEEVLPISAKIQNMVFGGVAAKLRAATPTVKEFSDSTKTNVDGVKTKQKTKSTKEEPGEITRAPEASLLDERDNLGKTNEALSGDELKTDPILRYMAATSLLQEVQLLNQYLKYAPISNKYKPYLVRLQISLMPNARNMPYDAYTILSFFPQDWRVLRSGGGGLAGEVHISPKKKASSLWPGAAPGGQLISAKALTGDRGTQTTPAQPSQVSTSPCEQQTASPAQDGEKQSGLLPKVIPMLVSDSLEAANYARSQEMLMRLALGVSAMVQGADLSAEFDSTLNKLKAATSYDLNSLFSVARVTPNTLRVRMGAYRQGVEAYTMVPRTHTVSVLLLVPKDYFAKDAEECDLLVMSKTVFVNALEGDPLKVRSEATALRGAKEVAQEYVPHKNWPMLDRTYNPCQPGLTCIQSLLNGVNNSNFPAFYSVAAHLGVSSNRTYSFWMDMVSTRCGGLYNMAYFPVPAPPKSSGPTMHKDVTAWLEDNGKDKTVAKVALALPDGKPLCTQGNSGEICVKITKMVLKMKTADPPLYLPAVSKDGEELCAAQPCEADFDSLKKWGFKAGDLTGKVTLVVGWKLGDKSGSDAYPGYYGLNTAQKGKPALSISTNTYAIMANGNKGSLNVNLTVAKDYKPTDNNALAVKIVGADLEDTKPETTHKDGMVPVKDSGTIKLNLANLKVYEPVKLIPMEGKTALEGSVCLPVCSNDNPLRGTLCLPVCPPKSN